MPADPVDAATKIAGSNEPALVLAIVMLLIVMAVVFALWRLVQSNHVETKAQLQACDQKHDDCEKKHDDCLRGQADSDRKLFEAQAQNRVLAQAVLDATQGRKHEASARAQTIVDLHRPA